MQVKQNFQLKFCEEWVLTRDSQFVKHSLKGISVSSIQPRRTTWMLSNLLLIFRKAQKLAFNQRHPLASLKQQLKCLFALSCITHHKIHTATSILATKKKSISTTQRIKKTLKFSFVCLATTSCPSLQHFCSKLCQLCPLLQATTPLGAELLPRVYLFLTWGVWAFKIIEVLPANQHKYGSDVQ